MYELRPVWLFIIKKGQIFFKFYLRPSLVKMSEVLFFNLGEGARGKHLCGSGV